MVFEKEKVHTFITMKINMTELGWGIKRVAMVHIITKAQGMSMRENGKTI